MKSYTNLEQSKKLAEILPLESADMCFNDNEPCWSLTALFGVLPFHLIIDNQRYAFIMIKGLDKNGETYAIKYAIFNTTFYFHLTDFYNNPVDACVEMIIKLHELNLL